MARKIYQVLLNGHPVDSKSCKPCVGYRNAQFARHDFLFLRGMTCGHCDGYPMLLDTDETTVCGSCSQHCRTTLSEVVA